MAGRELYQLFLRGNRFLVAEHTDQALAAYQRCMEQGMTAPGLVYNTGLCFELQCRFDDAGQIYERLTSSSPRYVRAWVGVANCCRHKGDRSSAMTALRKALEIDPKWPQAHYLLSALHMQTGDVEMSVKHALWGYVASADVGAQDTPHFVQAYHDNCRGEVYTLRTGAATLLDMLYSDAATEDQLLIMHRFFAASKTCPPLSQAVVPLSATTPMRVGYVSEHLASQTVGCCILSVLEQHSPGLDVYVYDLGAREAALPSRCVHRKYPSPHVCTPDIQKQILKDNLDVLVSLDGWTGSGAAMRVMEHKLAGVCVDMVGYPFSTGSEIIDFKVVDDVTDPEVLRAQYTERLLRLPGCFLCWQPKCKLPKPRVRSMKGPRRLLSSNNFKKLSPSFLRSCRRILDGSSCVLYFKCSYFGDSAKLFENIRDKYFEGCADRVVHVPHITDDVEHLRLTSSYDLALDPWPYNGTITTLECLASGVPVMCVLGDAHRSRVTASILTAVEHSELICMDEDHFVDQTLALLADGDKLTQYHAYLSRDLQRSGIMDAEAYTHKWEAALKSINPRSE